MTGKNRRNWRKKSHCDFVRKKSHKKKGPVLKLGLRDERLGTNSLNHGTSQLNVHNNNT
jgi:hypothetical protein